MIVPARRWLMLLCFVVLLAALTLLLSDLFDVISRLLLPGSPYAAPQGGSVKVFQQEETFGWSAYGVLERLRLFYLIGE